jgi:hypothetical protein
MTVNFLEQNILIWILVGARRENDIGRGAATYHNPHVLLGKVGIGETTVEDGYIVTRSYLPGMYKTKEKELW